MQLREFVRFVQRTSTNAKSCNWINIYTSTQITMAKLENAKMVVVGGRQDVQQQYCGTVGGESLDFADIDTEIKVR